jgi:hypothetical protein
VPLRGEGNAAKSLRVLGRRTPDVHLATHHGIPDEA